MSLALLYFHPSDPTHLGGYSLVQVEIWEGVSQLYYYFYYYYYGTTTTTTTTIIIFGTLPIYPRPIT